ncbi:MAG TPA: hypothetical protein VK463_06900 [Desulfomonilaceae bacterium]|nr:hypothetical protein [Desulfomonilaceae bacterium]
MRIKRLMALFTVAIFCLTSSLALAAGRNWFVIKNKRGVCKVVKTKSEPSAAIAGPFETKKEAQRVKEKECGTAAKQRKPLKTPRRSEPSSQTGEPGMLPTSPGQSGMPSSAPGR